MKLENLGLKWFGYKVQWSELRKFLNQVLEGGRGPPQGQVNIRPMVLLVFNIRREQPYLRKPPPFRNIIRSPNDCAAQRAGERGNVRSVIDGEKGNAIDKAIFVYKYF